MLETFKRAFGLPDLRRRLLFTLAVLLIFRFAAHVPVPGLNQLQLTRSSTRARTRPDRRLRASSTS